MLKNKISGQKGVALLSVYIIIVLLMVLTGAFFARTTITEKTATEREREALASFYVAEAGVDAGIRWLRTQATAPAGVGLVHSMRVNLPEGDAEVRICGDRNNPVNFVNRYIIFSLGTVLGPNGQVVASRQVIKEVQEESFAKYSYFSDDEHYLVWQRRRLVEVPVWFTTGSLLEGPVHTNSSHPDPADPSITYGFYISGDPVFAGPLTSVGNSIYYMHGGPPNDNPDFQQGITLGVEAIDTTTLDAGRLRNAAVSPGGLSLQGDTTAVLLSDGTMNVTNADQGWFGQNMPIPGNGALFVNNGDLTISGTLNGRMTAGANRNIIIPDNLVYDVDPSVDPASDDMLGLVSERDVIVDRDAPHDVSIYASIAATGVATATAGDGSFMVEEWWVRPPKGILRIYGGLIQIRRGPVGTFNSQSNEKVSGYDKDYHYDQRCRYNPPDWFPTTQDYDLLSSAVI